MSKEEQRKKHLPQESWKADKEKEPQNIELYNMGYDCQEIKPILNSLCIYAADSLKTDVRFTDLKSIGLRGNCTIKADENGRKTVCLNNRLKDTEALSTLTHELGHAAIHTDKPMLQAVRELEADCFSIMLESHLGMEITEGRRRHLAGYYQSLRTLAPKENIPCLYEIISRVFQAYGKEIGKIDEALEHGGCRKRTESLTSNLEKSMSDNRRDLFAARLPNTAPELEL